jgi:hypothetical protein
MDISKGCRASILCDDDALTVSIIGQDIRDAVAVLAPIFYNLYRNPGSALQK